MSSHRMLVLCLMVNVASGGCLSQSPDPGKRRTDAIHFLALVSGTADQQSYAIRHIESNWQVGDTVMMLEAARFTKNRQTRTAIFESLKRLTGEEIGPQLNPWFRWMWEQDAKVHPRYPTFKKILYSKIDSRFAEYFSEDYESTIRLDEVRWGGVPRDGIPPLKDPKTVAAAEATYLADSGRRLRRRVRRTGSGVSETDSRLARDGERQSWWSLYQRRVLHALRVDDRLRHPFRGEALRAGYERVFCTGPTS